RPPPASGHFAHPVRVGSLIDGSRVPMVCASAAPSTIGGLLAPGRAEARPASRYVGGPHDEVTAPAATTDEMRPLSSTQVPIRRAILHGGTYRNAVRRPPTSRAETRAAQPAPVAHSARCRRHGLNLQN